MTKSRIMKSALSTDDVNWLIKTFNESEDRIYNETSYTSWLDIEHNDLIKNWIADKLEFFSAEQINTGFIYEMNTAYMPHCDGTKDGQLQLNIPLERSYEEKQELVIFEQTTKVGPITWIDAYYPKRDEKTSGLNNLFYGPILPYQVNNHTLQHIDIDFYRNHLMRSPEIYWGLTPETVFEQIPGDVLVFDPNAVHCTGSMPKNQNKLGMVVRIDELPQ